VTRLPRVAALAALAISAALVAACAAPAGAAKPARHEAGPRTGYYLALGDSLSRGVQPDAAGASLPTGHGYPDQLYAALHAGDPELRLVKLGCSGETTNTMINGGICRYPAGSQLAQAVSFLRAHRDQVSLITIDIGANDPDSCIHRPTILKIAACITSSFSDTTDNLTKIMTRLRAAAGPAVRVIGMNYYVPALAEWRDGLLGQQIARLADRLVVGYNRLLTRIYTSYDARVADVFGAFHSADFTDRVTLPGLGRLPRNVATICMYTWECAAAPRGPNEHAREIGYGVIALAFLLADSRRPSR
jgi:lysophospholipase L1-like esterase